MGKDPAMPLYANDWLSSPRVQAMTQAQELAYFRLCLFCWASGDASLLDDDEYLASISRMGKGWFKGGSEMVRKCFEPHPTKEGHLTNSTVYRLWLERQEWREKSRQGGVKSGEKRKQSKGGSRVVQPKGNSSSSSSSSFSSSSSSSGGGSPHTPSAREVRLEPFDEWWKSVHHKIGREAAKKAYEKAVARVRMFDETRDPHAFLLERMKAFAVSPSAHPTDITPIHPATWLNQGRYDDDPATWNRTASRVSGSSGDPRGNLALRERLLQENQNGQ